MTWFPSAVCSLLLTVAASASPLQWQWQSVQGKQQIAFEVSERDLRASELEMQRLDSALNFPIESLYSKMGSKLEGSLVEINRVTPADNLKFASLEQALALQDDSIPSMLFWQAYQQYEEDAFFEMRIVPCQSQDRTPCVRPNYSQLFYGLKHALQPLARQFVRPDIRQSVTLLQEWLARIPAGREQQDHFTPPLQALERNQADSDEKALLMAVLLAELAPRYGLRLVYPDNSRGSVSPAWLIISADSGLPGATIMINQKPHVLLTGNLGDVKKLMDARVQLVSESLY